MRRTLNYENEVKIAKEQQKRGFKLQIIILIAICLLPSLAFFRDAGSSAFQWEKTQLTLNYPDGATQIMEYASITQVEYRESFDFGTPITGSTEDQCKYGLWSNDELGEYYACCHVDIPGCILFTTSDAYFAVSFESAETTLALYESVSQMLVDQGYLTS